MTQKTKSNYKNLTAYKKSKKLTLELVRFTKNNKRQEYAFIYNQILRSASSIGANIAEGYGRYYKKYYRQFVGIARGFAFETEYWLEILIEIHPQQSEYLNKLIFLNNEIIRLLTRMMKTLEA